VFLNASVLVLVAVFAYQILYYWMNPQFAAHGAVVLAVMALSQFIDSLTSLPSLVNDGMGHPRLSGMFALARALAGLGMVYARRGRLGHRRRRLGPPDGLRPADLRLPGRRARPHGADAPATCAPGLPAQRVRGRPGGRRGRRWPTACSTAARSTFAAGAADAALLALPGARCS
jgi:hypothetical protein